MPMINILRKYNSQVCQEARVVFKYVCKITSFMLLSSACLQSAYKKEQMCKYSILDGHTHTYKKLL